MLLVMHVASSIAGRKASGPWAESTWFLAKSRCSTAGSSFVRHVLVFE